MEATIKEKEELAQKIIDQIYAEYEDQFHQLEHKIIEEIIIYGRTVTDLEKEIKRILK